MCGIKVIIFDLDGVLISSKDLHFRAFNDALRVCGYDPISFDEHINLYDGLPTRQKIALYFNKNLPRPSFELASENIYTAKQKITKDLLKEYVEYDQRIVDLIFSLKNLKYKVYIATNSIRESTKFILETLGIDNLIDGYVCNQDVQSPKPHPESYLKIMAECSARPSETLILEDSPIGLKAAEESYANIFIVKKMSDVTLKNILNRIKELKPMSNLNKKEDINVLIPMAGLGSRFKEKNYTFPKPLIEVGKFGPMIKAAIDSLNINGHYIFLVRKEHQEKYNISNLLKVITNNNCCIIEVEKTTEGAACTALLAEKFIDNDKELIIANCDQFVEWDSNMFLYMMRNKNVDGGMLTFPSCSLKWSYAKIDKTGLVIDVAEKNPISPHACVGINYYKHGKDFVKYAQQMIKNNLRVQGEFYIMPVYSEYIKDNKIVRIYEINENQMWGLGLPEDMEYFINNYKKN